MRTIHAAPPPAQLDDAQLDSTFQEPCEIGREIAINLAFDAMLYAAAAGNIPGAYAAQGRMTALIKGRSAAEVARREVARRARMEVAAR